MVREPSKKALFSKNPPKDSIIHSNSGGQYISDNIKKLIKTFELRQCISRADASYDNATAESLWSRLKTAFDIPKPADESLEKLREILLTYAGSYYNLQRLHSLLDYQSPLTLEANYYK